MKIGMRYDISSNIGLEWLQTLLGEGNTTEVKILALLQVFLNHSRSAVTMQY